MSTTTNEGNEMTYEIASNGSIHRTGCEHGQRVRLLSGGYASVEQARRIALGDFDKVRIAPCAK